MPPAPVARVAAVAPGSPAHDAGLRPGDELLSLNGEAVRDVIRYQIQADEPRVELEVRTRRARAAHGRRQGRGRVARTRPRDRGVRPGAYLRQPLPVLLHLPAAQGHAAKPLPEGRRLPPVVPLRQLHHPHPLHRVRPRTGGHRAARPAVREHPRHRSRPAVALAAQPALARPACGGSARSSTRASKCTARSSCARASTTATRSTTPCSVSSTAIPLLATVGVVPLGVSDYTTEPDMRPHTVAEARRVLDIVDEWQARFTRCSVVAWCTPSDEYYLLAERPFPCARGLRRRWPNSRTASASPPASLATSALRSTTTAQVVCRHPSRCTTREATGRASSSGSTAHPPRATARRRTSIPISIPLVAADAVVRCRHSAHDRAAG